MPESCLACKRRGALQPDLADEVLKLWRIANLVEHGAAQFQHDAGVLLIRALQPFQGLFTIAQKRISERVVRGGDVLAAAGAKIKVLQ